MGSIFKQAKFKFFGILPLVLLFFISLNGISIINVKFFSVNIHYILVYYWVLRQPQSLGYGFIFLSGIISDIILGFPLGVNALSLLFANFIYFSSLYFSNYSVDYFYLLKNSVFTFIFYPILWALFSLILNIRKS